MMNNCKGPWKSMQDVCTSRMAKVSCSLLACLLFPMAMAAPVKIMPLGDSITQGNDGHDSYRYPLWNLLKRGGHSVDFVGSLSKPHSGSHVHNTGWDKDHEGHWGWRADQILDKIDQWAKVKPDIVLMHVGSNDAFQGNPNSSTIYEISNIIDRLRAANPKVVILLAKLIPAAKAEQNKPVESLNSELSKLAASKSSVGSKVILVDQSSGYSAKDNYDGVHPGPDGEAKMAAKWYAALKDVLKTVGK